MLMEFFMLILGAILAFLVSFLALRHVQPDGILFYQGIMVAVLVSLAQGIVAWKRLHEPVSTASKDAMLTFLLTYAFLFTVPTTVDRSYSVRMLEHVADSPRGLTREEVGRFYVQEFLENGGVDRRLTEQQVTGTLVERDGKYVLTRKGEALTVAFRVTCVAFACQHSGR